MYGLFGVMIGGFLISWILSRLNFIKKIYLFIYFIVVFSWIGLLFFGVKFLFMLVVILFFIIGFGNGVSVLIFVVVC